MSRRGHKRGELLLGTMGGTISANEIAVSVLTTWKLFKDTLKLIKTERNAKVAAKILVPANQNDREHMVRARENPQDGGHHMAQESLTQDDSRHMAWELPAQGGGYSLLKHPKMAEPACRGCSPLKCLKKVKRGRQPLGEGMLHQAHQGRGWNHSHPGLPTVCPPEPGSMPEPSSIVVPVASSLTARALPALHVPVQCVELLYGNTQNRK